MKKIYFSIIGLIAVVLIIILLINGKSSYALSTTLVDVVKNQSQTYNYTEGNGNGVYYTNNHEYRYVGANPNNYVKFNDDMYQIIGVFDDHSHGNTGKELVKLIRARILTASSYGVHNTGNNTGTHSNYSNDWAGTGQTSPSNSYLLLNEYFLNRTKTSSTYGDCSNWTYYVRENKTNDCNTLVGYGIKDSYRGYIEDVTWHLGYSFISLSKQDIYNCERGRYSGCTNVNSGTNDNKIRSKIGLMYPSDYLYASGYVASNATTIAAGVSASYGFGNSNWLYKGYEWTITPTSSYDDPNAFYVGSLGDMTSFITYFGFGIRPVLYLKSSVYVTGGTGTFDDPYLIACDDCNN